MPSKRDYLSIVEAAYAPEHSEADWVQGIAEAAHPILEGGLATLVYTYDASDLGRVRVGAFGQAGGDRPMETAARLHSENLPTDAARLFFCAKPPVELARRIFARVAPTRAISRRLEREQVDDAIGVRGHNPDGRGVVLSAPTPGPAQLSPRVKWALTCVAPHLAAAARLRLTTPVASRLEQPDAVFTATGRLEHLAESAAEPGAKRSLLKAIEQRRAATAVRADPARALQLWRALICGRWSILHHVDRDGKRFILARRNDPNLRDPAALTPSERLVLLYAAWGHSNKLIAYETGFAASTVSVHLRQALRKLRIKSRNELTRLFAS